METLKHNTKISNVSGGGGAALFIARIVVPTVTHAQTGPNVWACVDLCVGAGVGIVVTAVTIGVATNTISAVEFTGAFLASASAFPPAIVTAAKLYKHHVVQCMKRLRL